MRQCLVDNCENSTTAKGLCVKHYLRLRRHGSFELPEKPQKPEKIKKSNITHGHSKGNKRTKECMAYSHILDRCNNPKGKTYKYYGGRGIKCLFNSFSEFLENIGQAPTPKHTVERIDNNGHYEIGNVRWATIAEQAVNKRRNITYTYQEKTLCLAEWARELGVPYSRLKGRYRLGWPTDKIFDFNTNFRRQPHICNREIICDLD